MIPQQGLYTYVHEMMCMLSWSRLVIIIIIVILHVYLMIESALNLLLNVPL